jgi:hypothetical protein
MSKPRELNPLKVEEALSEIRKELETATGESIQRLDCNSEDLDKGLARLVLSLIELLRKLLERQAVRRMEGGGLHDQQVEEMGQALMRLEAKVAEMAAHFGLRPEELNLDLGPLGSLNPRD